MHAEDNLDGSADAEFGSSGAGAGRSRGKCSETGMATEMEFPRDSGPALSAIGLLNCPQGSNPPESSSKQSELRESGMLECGRHGPQRGSAIKSGDYGPATASDQLWSSIGCRSDEQVAQPCVNSEVQLPADGCGEPSKSPVGDVDTQNSLVEGTKIDECGEVLATASTASAGPDASRESVRKKRGRPNGECMGVSNERSSLGCFKNRLQMKGMAN